MDAKVYFGVCGAGLGHAGRCAPIAHRLARRGIRCYFSTYGPAVRFLRQEGFPTVASPPMQWVEAPDGGVDWALTGLLWPKYLRQYLRQIRIEKRRLREIRPDAVVCDSRYSTWAALSGMDIPDLFLTNQPRVILPTDPHGPMQRLFDRASGTVLRRTAGVLIPDIPPPDSIGTANYVWEPQVEHLIRYVGPIIHTAPEAVGDRREVRARLGIEDDEPFVYAALSGPGHARVTIVSAVHRALAGTPYKTYMSMGNPPDTRITTEGQVERSEWVELRYRMLRSCDALIARPGLSTISEALRYGLPMVLIPTPGQTEQEGNARRIEELGLGRRLPQRELTVEGLRAAVEELLEEEDFRKNARRYAVLAAEHDGAEAAERQILRVLDGAT